MSLRREMFRNPTGLPIQLLRRWAPTPSELNKDLHSPRARIPRGRELDMAPLKNIWKHWVSREGF